MRAAAVISSLTFVGTRWRPARAARTSRRPPSQAKTTTRALVAAAIHLAGYHFALIGGLVVMVRLQEPHRVDGVFDNPTDAPRRPPC